MSLSSTRLLASVSATAHQMLLCVSAALALAAMACAGAMLLDSRVLDNGHSVWVKPMRFCIAFGVHLLTLWWLAALTHRAASGDRWFGASAWLQALTALLELLCITLQAARGTHSHFNYATPFDHAVFTVMGLGTAVLLVGIALMIAGLVRWPSHKVPTVAAVCGLSFAVLGGLVGVWMVMPTPDQRLLLEAGQRLDWVGSPLSAAPSGSTAPLFGWDLRSGDWRVPHFLGLHALQAIPWLAWLHGRAGHGLQRVPQALWLGVAAYAAAFFGTVLWTASGRSVLVSSAASVSLLAAPAAVFAIAAAHIRRRRLA